MMLNPNLEILVNANSGAFAGLFATLAIAPFDSLKVLLQSSTGSEKQKGILAALIHKKNKEGFFALYRGVEAKVLWSMIGKWFYYGAYFLFSKQYEIIVNSPPGFFINLIIGSAADMSHVPITAPLEKIATQCVKHNEGAGDSMRRLYKQGGIWGFLPNPKLYLLLSISPSLTNTIFSQVKMAVLKARGKPNGVLGTFESFVLGAVARAIATCFIYPLIKAKVVMQAEKTMGIKQCLEQIYETGGFWGLYDGINLELVRAVCSSAVTLMIKERSQRMNRALIVSVLSLFVGKVSQRPIKKVSI